MPKNRPNAHRILIVDDLERIHDDFRKILISSVEHSDAGQALLQEAEAVFGPSNRSAGDEAGSEPIAGSDVTSFRIDSALQGQAALEMVNRAVEEDDPYAVAFVDMRMPPGWDGLYTVEQLWGVAPDLQVVICTAYSDYSWNEISERVGTRDNLLVLKKPFDSIEVHQMATALAQKWLERRQQSEKRARLETELSESADALERLESRIRSQNICLSTALLDMHRAARRIVAHLDAEPTAATKPQSAGEVRRLQGHLDDLVDYLRISAGEDVLDHEQIEVKAFVSRLRGELGRDFGGTQGGRMVSVETEGDMPEHLYGDPRRIGRIARAVAQDVIARSNGEDVMLTLSCEQLRGADDHFVICGASTSDLSVQQDQNGMGLVELLTVLMRGDCEFSGDQTRVVLRLPKLRQVA